VFQQFAVQPALLQHLAGMFQGLEEPAQVLAPESPRPLVVHRVVSQLTLVAEGRGVASLAGKELELSPGTLLLLAPGCEHAFGAAGGRLVLHHWHWPQDQLAADRTVLRERHDFTHDDA